MIFVFFYRDISNYPTLVYVQAAKNHIGQITTKTFQMPKLETSVSFNIQCLVFRWSWLLSCTRMLHCHL